MEKLYVNYKIHLVSIIISITFHITIEANLTRDTNERKEQRESKIITKLRSETIFFLPWLQII